MTAFFQSLLLANGMTICPFNLALWS